MKMLAIDTATEALSVALHDALYRVANGGGLTAPPRALQFEVQQRPGPQQLSHLGDHREHDRERPAVGSLDQRAQLAPQHRRTVEADTDRPPTHRRIVVTEGPDIGQHLVSADIERAECHGPAVGNVEHAAVQPGLGIDVGKLRPHHERDLGAIKPNAVSSGLLEMLHVIMTP